MKISHNCNCFNALKTLDFFINFQKSIQIIDGIKKAFVIAILTI